MNHIVLVLMASGLSWSSAFKRRIFFSLKELHFPCHSHWSVLVQSYYSGMNDECHSTSRLPFCELSIPVQHSQPTPHSRYHDIPGPLSSFPLLKLWDLLTYNEDSLIL